MKSSIEHLPEDKQAKLVAMAEKIREMAPDTGMIVLFGSQRGWLSAISGVYERLFKLLKRSYIDSRYSRSFRITAEELATLGERVKDPAGRIERVCREKLGPL